MPTQCSQTEMDFGSSGGRKLVGAFDGGAITSNGGAVLLVAADRAIRLSERLAECFRDLRAADAVKHSLADLLRQRIFGIALGYEDLIDHDALRFDPALTAVLDKATGQLAGKSGWSMRPRSASTATTSSTTTWRHPATAGRHLSRRASRAAGPHRARSRRH